MAKTLKQIGFDVTTQIDGTYTGMRKAIVNFGRKLKRSGGTTTGLVFYAGHGIQANGKNYLIPVNAQIEDEAELEIAAVDANWILAMMDGAQNDLNFVILDACRNNPFARAFRSVSRGLGRMDAPSGTMIAYATSPGEVAADGIGLNSPYTLALTEAMLKPNLSSSDMFIDAHNQVMKATGEKQVPWEEGAITAKFYFAGLTTTTEATTQQTNMTPEMMFWQSIQNSQSVSDYEAYLSQYPDGSFSVLAKSRIELFTSKSINTEPE